MRSVLAVSLFACVLAACNATPAPPPSVFRDKLAARGDGLAETYPQIAREYIAPVDYGALVVAGLSSLSTIDANLNVVQQDGQMVLLAGGARQGAWTLPGGDADESRAQWDSINRQMLEAAEAVSPPVKAMGRLAVWQHMLRGVLTSLDPRNSFHPFDDPRNCKSGIGVVTLDKVPQGAKIVQLRTRSPALEGGIRRGDVVAAINGAGVAEFPLSEIYGRLCGPPGSSVALTLVRNGQRLEKSLQRAPVVEQTIESEMRGKVLVIRLYGFHADTARMVKQAIQRGEAGGMEAVVLDLRRNGGGLLDQVVETADLFVANGVALTIRARRPEDTKTYRARPDAIKVPVAVIVDTTSSSGAEVLAAALQDSAGAFVVGTLSAGVGHIRTMIPTFDHGSVGLVTGTLVAPSGYEIAGRGVLPDRCTVGGRARDLPRAAVKQWSVVSGADLDALKALCPPEDHDGTDADVDAAIAGVLRSRR